MRRIAVLTIATMGVLAMGAQELQAQQPTDSAVAARVRAAVNAAPEVASMDWAQATQGALTEAPYPVYPGTKLGVAADAGEIYMVSMMSPDAGTKVDAFYTEKLPGWTRRELPGGAIAFVKGDQAKARGVAAVIQGPAVLIEPRESTQRPYTLITFQTAVKQQ